MKKNVRLAIWLTLLCASCLHAQFRLDVNNPETWQKDQGSISEAVLQIQPQGAYMAVDMSLTFNAENTTLEFQDSLEVVLDFDLPAEAIIYDSWLWIDNTIVEAQILDKWSASAIYEEIVDRRRDPSILQKIDHSGHYQLRVYPMDGNSTRKVKLSLLLPVEWGNGKASIELPFDILKTSKNDIASIVIQSIPDPQWSNIRLEGETILPLPFTIDENGDTLLEMSYDSGSFPEQINFVADVPTGTELLYVAKNQDEKTYELICRPDQLLGLENNVSRTVVVAIGYDPWGTLNMSRQQLLDQLRASLKKNMHPADRFNVVYGVNGQLASDQWLNATPATIDQVFDNISPNELGQYADNLTLLTSATTWVQNNDIDNQAGIILVSNTNNEASIWPVNYYVDLVMELMSDHIIPISILDYQNTNYTEVWINFDQVIIGNSYFYDNISRLTGGIWEKTGSIDSKTRRLLRHFDPFAGILDINTRLENGVCYQRQIVNGNNIYTPFAYTNIQLGRFEGSFPMVLELSAIYQDSFYHASYTIDEASIYSVDTLVKEMWVGNLLSAGETSSNSNNAYVYQLIQQSIQERVLCLYTAFLCLEPGVEVDPCWACSTFNPILVDATDRIDHSIETISSPNPFSDKVVVDVKGLAFTDNVYAVVTDMAGRLIIELTSLSFSASGHLQLEWDGRDAQGREAPTGMYIISIQTPQGLINAKVIKQ